MSGLGWGKNGNFGPLAESRWCRLAGTSIARIPLGGQCIIDGWGIFLLMHPGGLEPREVAVQARG